LDDRGEPASEDEVLAPRPVAPPPTSDLGWGAPPTTSLLVGSALGLLVILGATVLGVALIGALWLVR
jgi:hypothetical protein